MNIEDCYQILELKSGATINEIKAARNELLQVWHPDKYVSNSKLSEKAREKTLRINEAFNILVKDLEAAAQNPNPPDDFQKELQRYSKKQESILRFSEKRAEQTKRAKRQLNLTLLAAVLIGFFGFVLKLQESAFLLVLVILVGGFFMSFLTYRKPIRKK